MEIVWAQANGDSNVLVSVQARYQSTIARFKYMAVVHVHSKGQLPPPEKYLFICCKISVENDNYCPTPLCTTNYQQREKT